MIIISIIVFQLRDYCLDTVAAPFVLADPCKGLPPEACEIHTPLKPRVWQRLLEDHPDKWFANYIHRGIEQGFRIGFHGEQASLVSHVKNMISAGEHQEVVDMYLKGERADTELQE